MDYLLDNSGLPVSFPQQHKTVGALQIITAADVLFNHVDDDLPMWSGEGDRALEVKIVFETPFKTPPMISLGLSGMDCDNSQNFRFWLKATSVEETGFTIEFTTWGATHIARAGVSWQAIGEAAPAPAPAKAATSRAKK